MDKNQCCLLLVLMVPVSLGLVSFISCLLAEFNKAKKEDVRLDNDECYVEESKAFWYGVGAIICLVVAQIIGNLIICSNLWTNSAKKPKFAVALWVFSWTSFGAGVIILSGATTMSRKQEYGKGWIDGDCHLLKDGIFIASSILVLFTLSSTFASAFPILYKSKPPKLQPHPS